jgi:hypothetical protein
MIPYLRMCEGMIDPQNFLPLKFLENKVWRITPAMKAGIVNHIWGWEDINI